MTVIFLKLQNKMILFQQVSIKKIYITFESEMYSTMGHEKWYSVIAKKEAYSMDA
jgi:hypothetical protein